MNWCAASDRLFHLSRSDQSTTKAPLREALIVCLALTSLLVPRAESQIPKDSIPAGATPEYWLGRSDEAWALGTKEGKELTIEFARRGIEGARAPDQPSLRAYAMVLIAKAYWDLTQIDSALHYGGKIVDLGKVEGLAVIEARGFAVLAGIYAYIGRPDSAFVMGDEALNLCPIPCAFEVGLKTRVSRWLPDSLRREMLLALEVDTRKGTSIERAQVLNELGIYYTESEKAFERGLFHHRMVYDLEQANVWTLYGMGRAFRGLGMADSAFVYFTWMLNEARRSGTRWGEAFALGNLGQVCHRDLVPPLIDCAIAYYDSTITLARTITSLLGSDLNRTMLGEFAFVIYRDAALAWLSASDAVGERTASEMALWITELGRAQALFHLIVVHDTTAALHGNDIDDTSADAEVAANLWSSVATLSYLVSTDTILIWLTRPGPDIRTYRRAIALDSLAVMVKRLRTAIGADDALVRSRLRGVDNGQLLSSLKENGDLDVLTAIVGGLLLPPDLAELVPRGTDLVIVPQGALGLVPFGILGMPGRAGRLGDFYPLRYAPSLFVLAALEARLAKSTEIEKKIPRSVLVVADPEMPTVDIEMMSTGIQGMEVTLSRLPSAQREGEWVAERLGGVLLSGKSATETRIRSQISQADIVHFATHGLAMGHWNKAGNSFLAFAPDSINDGLLTVGELLNDPSISLSARLVVLSACQTAMGAVFSAEGTLGLQRAFLAKGAQSLLVSLWSVDDEATSLLMKRFYTHWLDDADNPQKAEALSRAQQDVRETPGYSHPIYWAAFQLVGAN